MKKKLSIVYAFVLIVLAFTACRQTDLIGQTSITSFNAVLTTIPDKITADEPNGGWVLTAPDNTARFFWSKDFSGGLPYDVMLEIDAEPFIDAGLDVSKLPAGTMVGGKIRVGTNLGDNKLSYSGEATPLSSYEQIVNLNRDHIKYHAALDHYGVDISGGNMFEWAKDMNNNDKDIVFVLNPQIFTDAGVDPEGVQGWIFAKVEVMSENGKKTEVDKFLKPFDLV